jgi:gentisate 1,2-dioxygenase
MHRHRSLAAIAGSGALDIGDEALDCSSHNVFRMPAWCGTHHVVLTLVLA